MTPLLFVGVAVAGGLGAVLRYVLDLAIHRWLDSGFPWGILAVNLTGALALGVLAGGVADSSGLWLLGTGLLGGYTTFSSVAVTTVLLAHERRGRVAAAYAVGTFAGSVALATTGVWIGMLMA